MNNKEMTRYKADQRAKDWLDKHNDELVLIPLYADIKSAFVAELIKLDTAFIKQSKRITHVAQIKNKLRLEMAATMVKFLNRAAVQAFNLQQVGLVTLFSVGKTHFTRGEATGAAVRARNLMNTISQNHDVITIITDDDLTEMETIIKKYENQCPKPKMAINDRCTMGTKIIPISLNKLDFLKEQLAKLIASYYPQWSREWYLITKVGHATSIRHLSLILIVTDAATATPIRKLKCTVSNQTETHSKLTTRRGSARFKSLQTDVWKVTIEAKYYETKVIENVITTEGKVNRLHVNIVKTNDQT